MRRRPGAALVRGAISLDAFAQLPLAVPKDQLSKPRRADGERTARIGGDRKGRRGPSDRITVAATAKAPGLGPFGTPPSSLAMIYNTCT